jgi:HD-GYP domain-containing protein (c-di-GMP phosphodiesterase class II)
MSDYRQIKSGTLKPQDPLPWDIYDSQGTLLLAKGHRIENESRLEELITNGLYSRIQQNYYSCNQKKKIYSIFESWNLIENELNDLLRKPPLDGSFPEKSKKLISILQKTSMRSPNAAIAFMLLADNVFYPISHSLHVALLTNLLTSKLDWPSDRVISTLGAALTMNIAMIRLQGELSSVSEPLNAEQKRSVEAHPALGVSLLKRLGVDDPLWLQAVLEHHERPDGNGYPNKIASPCQSALIIRTCDIFSAKLSPRVNRKRMDAASAAKVLFMDEGTEANNPFPDMLIKEVGIYPPGCLVKLYNGEICIVSSRGNTAHTPIVQLLKNSNGLIVAEAILRDTSKKEFKIHQIVANEEFNAPINANKIWG